jgi:Protein of unknown function (DUF4231)
MNTSSNPSAKYMPPGSPDELVLAWIRRTREAQMSHYEMAEQLSRRHHWMGVPVIVIAAVVGTSAFASVLSELIPLWAKLCVGAASVLAAVLAALQTFFKFSERAERHKTFGAKFGAVRRELETLHASGHASQEANYVNMLREKLDRLAEEAPAVPSKTIKKIQYLG